MKIVWRELEEQVRDWARDIGPVNVRIELKFSSESQVLPTGATVPDGFYKFLTFSDNRKMCFYEIRKSKMLEFQKFWKQK